MALCCLQRWEYVLPIRVYDIDLVSVIFRSTFVHDTQAQPQASWDGGHQLKLTITFVFLQGKVNRAATLHWFVTLCYCHFLDGKVNYFFPRSLAN